MRAGTGRRSWGCFCLVIGLRTCTYEGSEKAWVPQDVALVSHSGLRVPTAYLYTTQLAPSLVSVAPRLAPLAGPLASLPDDGGSKGQRITSLICCFAAQDGAGGCPPKPPVPFLTTFLARRRALRRGDHVVPTYHLPRTWGAGGDRGPLNIRTYFLQRGPIRLLLSHGALGFPRRHIEDAPLVRPLPRLPRVEVYFALSLISP